MQGHKHSKGISKSKMGLQNPRSGWMGSGYGMGRVRQDQAYGVPRTESRVEVRMENTKSNGYKVRVLETNLGEGGVGIRVPVQCCMECNMESNWLTGGNVVLENHQYIHIRSTSCTITSNRPKDSCPLDIFLI